LKTDIRYKSVPDVIFYRELLLLRLLLSPVKRKKMMARFCLPPCYSSCVCVCVWLDPDPGDKRSDFWVRGRVRSR
jgi:hypothetical protein